MTLHLGRQVNCPPGQSLQGLSSSNGSQRIWQRLTPKSGYSSSENWARKHGMLRPRNARNDHLVSGAVDLPHTSQPNQLTSQPPPVLHTSADRTFANMQGTWNPKLKQRKNLRSHQHASARTRNYMELSLQSCDWLLFTLTWDSL